MPPPAALAHRGPTKPMHHDESWFEDATGGLRLKSRPRGYRGGEYDWLDKVPARARRRLAGAGYISARGDAPDVLTDTINASGLLPPMSLDAAMSWWWRTALFTLDARRRHAHQVRHQRVARAHGHRTYYAHRDACARAAGHRSLYHYRLAKGWPPR